MEINLIPDASVSSAPAGFTAAVQAAADVLDQDFPGNYTINISYGWGTWDNEANSSLTNPNSGDFSLGGPVTGAYLSYATVRSALIADATLSDQIAAVASLPTSNTALPDDANTFYVSGAEEIALGMTSPSSALDGAIGFNVGDTTDPSYWETAALCEIGHALGWDTAYYTTDPSLLDLFRYASPGVRQWTGGQPAYFSINGGTTDLANFSTSFDYTLFTNVASNDPFNVAGDSTLAQGLSSLDIEVLNVIGFGGTPAAPPVLTISNSNTLTNQTTQTISGTIDAADAGLTVSIYDGGELLGTATPAANGKWSASVTLPAIEGVQTIAAQATRNGIVGTSNAVTYGLDTYDLADIGYLPSYEIVFDATAAGGALQIIDTASDNSVLATLAFIGSYAGESFMLTGDGSTGSDIYLAAVPYATPMPGDVVVSNIDGQAYSAYEELYSEGVYTGIDYYFTNISNQPYSSFEYDYSAGNDFIGSKFFYTDITEEAYTGYEYDYDGGGDVTRIDFTGVSGSGYSSYEYDYVGGVFAGSKFEVTAVPAGATYSSYELDYNSANAFVGSKFFFTNLPGQSYTGEEEDLDANGALTRVLLTGVTGQAYSSLEEDFSAGTYTGYKAYYTGITGQSYTCVEVDVSATNQLTKAVYSGLSGTPYSSIEEDFSGSALTGSVYDFTDVTGTSYYAYQVDEDANGNVTQEILDNKDGSHTIVGLGAANQTFTSIADDTFSGGGPNETFVFQPVYGHDTITDIASYLTGAGHDTLSFSTSEFATVAAVLAAAQNVGGNVAITAVNGDTLTLDNTTTSALAASPGDFTFHS